MSWDIVQLVINALRPGNVRGVESLEQLAEHGTEIEVYPGHFAGFSPHSPQTLQRPQNLLRSRQIALVKLFFKLFIQLSAA